MNNLDKDRLNGANQREVARGVMAILDRMQRLESGKEVQILAAAAVFLELCRLYKVTPQSMFSVVGNMLSRETSVVPEYRAMRDYVEKECGG